MTINKSAETAQAEALGHVTFLDGQGELPMIEISTPWSTAEIYLHGAQVTRFKKNEEPPLLFLSQCSRFLEGQPIRGGVPVIFPWFGPREGLGQHGKKKAEVHGPGCLPQSIQPQPQLRCRP